MDDLLKTLHISASGMRAQTTRMWVSSENIANSDSLPRFAGDEPYRRKTITFRNIFDRELGADRVKVDKIGVEAGDFEKQFKPGHPAADADGYVQVPNVNSLIEINDIREAQRSYEANLNVIRSSRSMLQKTIDILR